MTGTHADRFAGHIADEERCTRSAPAAPGEAWVRFAVAGGVVAGVVDLQGSRFNLNPDGISYVELALHAVQTGAHSLINGYWSPGYPALVAPVLRLSGSMDAAIPALHLVNFVLYLIAIVLFIELCTLPGRAPGGTPLPRPLLALAILASAAITLQCIGLGLLTPDMAVLVTVMATAICCLRMEAGKSSWRWPLVLGLMPGAGYWMKGILLPLNALLFVLLLIRPPRIARARPQVVLAAGVFAVVSLPLIVLISSAIGRPSIGEVGRLNYAWEVDGVLPFAGWTGDTTTRYGAPIHPPRVLVAEPRTLEFATPVVATYPLWYDPAYWYDGVRARFDPAGQLRVLAQGFSDLGTLLRDLGVIVAVLAAFQLTSTRVKATGTKGRMPLVLLVWAALAMLVYAAVHIEPRYLAGFVVLITAVAWSRIAVRVRRRGTRWLAPVGAAAMLLALGWYIAQNTGGFGRDYRPDYLIDADSLRAHGVASGDAVAAVGDAFEQYAVFGVRAHFTAQVMDSVGYWELTPARRDSLDARLSAAGVTAVLANNVTAAMAAEGWLRFVRADSTNLGVRFLRPR